MPSLNQLRAERAFSENQDAERNLYNPVQATLGDGSGNVSVTDRPGWVWARLHGDANRVVQAFVQVSVPIVQDFAVDLKVIRAGGSSMYVLIGRSAFVRYPNDPFWSSGISGAIGQHAAQHMRGDRNTGGFDPLDVNVRAIYPLRAIAQTINDMTLFVEPGYYYVSSYQYWAGGNSPAFVAPTSFGASRYDLLILDSSSILQIVQGNAGVWTTTPTFPTVPLNCIPLAFVYLDGNTATLGEANIVDARVLSTAATNPSGGTAPADAQYWLVAKNSNLPQAQIASLDSVVFNLMGWG